MRRVVPPYESVAVDRSRDEWLAKAMASAAKVASANSDLSDREELMENSQFSRTQMHVLQRYTYMCTLLSKHERLLNQPEPLVSLRFPVQLTPKTHRYLIDGLCSSFTGFINQAHNTVMYTNVEFLEPNGIGPASSEFCNEMAADLWVLTTNIVDRKSTTAQARKNMIRILEDFSYRVIDEEIEGLRRLHIHLDCLRDACIGFGRRMLHGKKRIDVEARRRVARCWLSISGREGVALSVYTLTSHRRHAALFARLDIGRVVAALRSIEELTNEALEGVYECMQNAHTELAACLTVEIRRVDWLVRAPRDHACWSGVVVEYDRCDHAADERLLQAPSHLGSFATGRLRVVADPVLRLCVYSYGLTRVRLARVVIQLLRDSHLPLNLIGQSFARRITAYEYAKYEQAAMRIESDVLGPFGRTVNVPYIPGALLAAISDTSFE